MKNSIKWLRTVALVATLGFATVACGGGDGGGGGGGGGNPKALAKLQYELTLEAVKHQGDEKKLAEIRKKMNESSEKVNKLSQEDQKIFGEEINRLSSGK